jgi:TatD DNase family protein
MLIDSHCHIETEDFDADRDDVIHRAQAEGVDRILCIGTGDWNRRSVSRAVQLAENFDCVDTTTGIHPHDAEFYDEHVEKFVLQFASHHKVIGWGEIGLDYHYMHAAAEKQRLVFRRQMELARDAGLPVIIHSREAGRDTVSVLEQSPRLDPAGVMHCFGGDWEMAGRCMDLGFLISFAGNVTFKNARDLQEVARKVPLDRLLVETDSPFLAPVPVRGRRNEPAHVKHVARFLADLRDEPLERIENQTTKNFYRLFKAAVSNADFGMRNAE